MPLLLAQPANSRNSATNGRINLSRAQAKRTGSRVRSSNVRVLDRSVRVDGGPAVSITPADIMEAHRTLRMINKADGYRMPSIRAGYESALTTTDNARLWEGADHFDADTHASPHARAILRARCRYEAMNNCYAAGIIATLANECIGGGPQLQVDLGDEDANDRFEQFFYDYCCAINLPELMRLMRDCKARTGEAFIREVQDESVDHPVKVRLVIYEGDQIATPGLDYGGTDGMELDQWGNPRVWHVLREHPGAMGAFSTLSGAPFTRVKAEQMFQYFTRTRPNQRRGVPDITPSLPLFAMLRRYTLAVLGAAETAAGWAGVLYTDTPPGGESENVEPLDELKLHHRSLLTVPGGWKLGQIKAEQPTTTFPQFKRELLSEAGRPHSMPYCISAADASGHNFASARLDVHGFQTSMRVERVTLEETFLRWMFKRFVAEAVLVEGLLPQRYRMRGAPLPPHRWLWPGFPHPDENKRANARKTDLETGVTSLADVCAEDGKDWRQVIKQRGIEKKFALLHGMELYPKVKPAPSAPPTVEDTSDEDEESDESEQEESDAAAEA